MAAGAPRDTAASSRSSRRPKTASPGATPRACARSARRAHRADALPEHGRRLAEALRESEQAQHANRVPPPQVGEVAAAAGHDEISLADGLNRGPGAPGEFPARGRPGRYGAAIFHAWSSMSRSFLGNMRTGRQVGECPANGNRARAIRGEPGRLVGDDHDLGIRPLRPQTGNTRLQHRDVTDIQQIIAGLVNQNAHYQRRPSPLRVRGATVIEGCGDTLSRYGHDDVR